MTAQEKYSIVIETILADVGLEPLYVGENNDHELQINQIEFSK